MGVRVVFPDMGKDPSVQLIEKTITENGTYDAITDGANGYSKVNVNVGGGGGSSDFSTAEVTFENVDASTMEYQAQVSAIKDNSIKADTVDVLSPVTVTVPLYKGVNILPINCLNDIDHSYRPTTDGSIEFDFARGGFVVTGNGTIKAKGENTLINP